MTPPKPRKPSQKKEARLLGRTASQVEETAQNASHFEDVRPNWSATAPQPAPLVPGGLFVGAAGQDTHGLEYRLIAPLDRGGMGELFVAEVSGPPNTPPYAVVKRLLPDLLDDADYVEMFRAEARIMAQLNHPNIVQVLGMPVLEGSDCLALEFVEGRSVQQLVSRGHRLHVGVPPSLAAYVAVRMAEALDHVHHARSADGRPLELVHRDVSPGNVLLGFDGAVKLTDFGIAKTRMSAVSTTVGIVKGKARYLAPEQILGKNASPRSDLFSAALVLVEMLTSKPLFERGTIPKTLYSIVNGERPPMKDILPKPAYPLAALLEKALQTDPKRRLPSARAFADGLNDIIPKLGPSIDADALGQHLRGVFEGTRGPLTRAVPAPALNLNIPQRGSAPLDPDNFPQSTPPRVPSASVDESEGHAEQRSTAHEVNDALSVLAWLQSRDDPNKSNEFIFGVLPKGRWFSHSALFLAGWGGGLLAALAALVMFEARLSTVVGAFTRDRWRRSPEITAAAAPTKAPLSSTQPPPVAPSSPRPSTPAEPVAGSQLVASGLVFHLAPLPAYIPIGPPTPPKRRAKPTPARATPSTSALELAPVQGLASLDILIPRRARIIVDGRRLARRVPIKNYQLTPGPHRVEIVNSEIQRVFELRVDAGETIQIGDSLRRSPTGSELPIDEQSRKKAEPNSRLSAEKRTKKSRTTTKKRSTSKRPTRSKKKRSGGRPTARNRSGTKNKSSGVQRGRSRSKSLKRSRTKAKTAKSRSTNRPQRRPPGT